jgi:hypothetical protein
MKQVTELTPKRPEPPATLNEGEAATWVSTTATRPPDYFRADSFPLLESYCKHVQCARLLDDEIGRFKREWLGDPDGMKRYKTLTDMRERESRAITALARTMRLTHQAQYTPQNAGTVARKTKVGKRPWE